MHGAMYGPTGRRLRPKSATMSLTDGAALCKRKRARPGCTTLACRGNNLRISIRLALLSALAASSLLADVTYDQSVKYTGGSVLDLAKMMAKNPMMARRGGMASAFQDQNFTVYIKGSKMARIGPNVSTIIDLDAGTITTVNNQAHTYSTRTFDEMRQNFAAMQHGQSGDMQFDVKVDKTGKTHDIEGQAATETIVSVTAKAGSSNPNMAVKLDEWVVPATPSTREATDFQTRLSEKFSLALGGMPGMGAAASGISAAMKEGFKLDGYPALSDMSVTGVTAPMMNQKGDPNAPFLETETRSSHFVSGPVDDSKFAIPAGYTQEAPRGARPQ
jgi:hypothetical protein